MRCWAALGIVGVMSASATMAADLSRATACPDFLQARRQDPKAPGMQATSDQLVVVIGPYLPAHNPPQKSEAMVYALVAAAADWCTKNPHGTLGLAVDAAARQAHLTRRPPGQGSVLLVTPSPPPASEPPDDATRQALEVFRSSCLAFGTMGGLRAWAVGQGLRGISTLFMPRLSFGQSGIGYNVGTAHQPMELISDDDGSCRLVVWHGVAGQFETGLEHVNWGKGFSFRVRADVLNPQYHSRQRFYDAEAGGWGQDVLVIDRPYLTPQLQIAQVGGSMILLVATPRHPSY